MNSKITARPCKEQPGKWEIEKEDGHVEAQHYQTKDECVTAARRMANECGCELCVCDDNENCGCYNHEDK